MKYIWGTGIILALGCLILFILSFFSGLTLELKNARWVLVIAVFTGAQLLLTARMHKKREQCFISFDEKKIRYMLPLDKKVEVIKRDEIQSIETGPSIIRIYLPDTTKSLFFAGSEFSQLKKIKETFEEINRTTYPAGN